MQYFELTDPFRKGDVIMTDGRRHFRFSFGPCQWERTTIFLAYLTDGTGCAGQYREITEEEAQTLLLKKGRLLSNLLAKAERMAAQANQGRLDRDGQPRMERVMAVADSLSDLEEKIAALLHDLCTDTPWTEADLKSNGFTPQICRAVGLLTRPAGMRYGDYLTRLRQNRIARNVKLTELSRDMDLSGIPNPDERALARAETCRRARQYLYGDIPEFREELDESGFQCGSAGPVPVMNIYQALNSQALGGRKIPHGLSNPVLRSRDGKLYLAFFVYTFTRQELQSGAISRPVSWMLADLETGRLIEEIPCSREDFSRASREEKYATQNPNGKAAADFYEQTYGMLDRLRQAYLKNGVLDQNSYESYLNRMLQAVPPSYHRFYRELSKP